MRTLLIAVILSVTVGMRFLGPGPSAAAQAPPPPNPFSTSTPVPLATPQRGDVVYAFSDEQPVNDPRVGLALAVLIDQQLNDSVRPHILPADERLRVAATPVQVLQLLAAAGFAGRPPFSAAGPCRLWAAPPPVDVQPAVAFGPAAKEFDVAFLSALAQLGLVIPPCSLVPEPNGANILLWYQGGPAPAVPKRPTPTLLTSPAFAPPVVNDFPRAPVDGNSAVLAHDGGMQVTARALLVVIGGLLLSGAVAAGRVLLSNRSARN